jgi:3-oxoacyl-[acyl-carrier-protein] synthase III
MSAGRVAQICGWGACLPERVLTNRELETSLGLEPGWIFDRTGIRERRISGADETSASLGAIAAKAALQRAGLDATELDLIVAATISPDYLFPATACLIQDAIGARCGAFDLEAGCSSFVYGLVVASQMISAGAMDTVLVVGTDTLTRFVDYNDPPTAALFGDGAGAGVLRRGDGQYGIRGWDLGANGAGAGLLSVPAGGSAKPASALTVAAGEHFIQMNGPRVFRFASSTLGPCVERVLASAGWCAQDVRLVVPHQANVRIIEGAQKRTSIPADRFWLNIDRFGNTSSGSVPIALAEAAERNAITSGDNLVLVAFGTGLTWAGAGITWGASSPRPT